MCWWWCSIVVEWDNAHIRIGAKVLLTNPILRQKVGNGTLWDVGSKIGDKEIGIGYVGVKLVGVVYVWFNGAIWWDGNGFPQIRSTNE